MIPDTAKVIQPERRVSGVLECVIRCAYSSNWYQVWMEASLSSVPGEAASESAYLRAMLRTMAIAPGLCMHIMGMLNAPTSFALYVWYICGMYWMAARMADETPKNVAQMDTSGASGVSEDGFVVPRRRKVTNTRSRLGGVGVSGTVAGSSEYGRTNALQRPRRG